MLVENIRQSEIKARTCVRNQRGDEEKQRRKAIQNNGSDGSVCQMVKSSIRLNIFKKNQTNMVCLISSITDFDYY